MALHGGNGASETHGQGQFSFIQMAARQGQTTCCGEGMRMPQSLHDAEHHTTLAVQATALHARALHGHSHICCACRGEGTAGAPDDAASAIPAFPHAASAAVVAAALGGGGAVPIGAILSSAAALAARGRRGKRAKFPSCSLAKNARATAAAGCYAFRAVDIACSKRASGWVERGGGR